MSSRGSPAAHSRDPENVLPFEPVDAGVLLTPADFDIPAQKRPFTPTQLARYLYTDAKTIIRMIEDGILRALELRRGTYRIPYIEIVMFFARQQGADN
jgi:excisionase family DNA binding protein